MTVYHARIDDLSVRTGDDEPAAVGAEFGRAPTYGAWILQNNRAPFDVPDSEGEAGIMLGRQEAAIRTEAEDIDVAFTSGLESGHIMIVIDILDVNRPIPHPKRVASHCRVEGDHNHSGRAVDHSAGLAHVR